MLRNHRTSYKRIMIFQLVTETSFNGNILYFFFICVWHLYIYCALCSHSFCRLKWKTERIYSWCSHIVIVAYVEKKKKNRKNKSFLFNHQGPSAETLRYQNKAVESSKHLLGWPGCLKIEYKKKCYHVSDCPPEREMRAELVHWERLCL